MRRRRVNYSREIVRSRRLCSVFGFIHYNVVSSTVDGTLVYFNDLPHDHQFLLSND